MCETYGLQKQGAKEYAYNGVRGYHPLLAIAAGSGQVLFTRLRQGRANPGRGAAHFLTETISRVRQAGAPGELTVRADSGFYNRTVIGACRKLDVRFSVTVRLGKSLRALIEEIPEEAWAPIPYWLPGAADVAEIPYVPFQGRAQVRLIVRRVKPTPGSQLALLTNYSYHGCHRPGRGDAGP